MDIVFERESWAHDPAGRAAGTPRSPDWHGLRMRLAAACVARRALGEAAGVGDDASGSFDGGSARALADYGQSLSAVNPVFWANGKPVRSMDAAIAGRTPPGDRG